MKIFNDKGMSLIQVMIASAISIGIAMGIMRMNKTSQKTMQKVKSDSDLIGFKTNLQSRLGDKEFCTDMLGSTAPTGGLDISALETDVTDRFAAAGGIKFTVGTRLLSAPGFDVEKGIITQFESKRVNSPIGSCELQLTLVRNNQNTSYGGKHISVKIPLTCEVVNNPASLVISSCFSAFGGGAGTELWRAENDTTGTYIAFLGMGDNPRALIGQADLLSNDETASLSLAPVIGQNWVQAPVGPVKHGLAIADNSAITFGLNNEIGLWKEADVLKLNSSFESSDTIIAQNELSAPRHWAFNYFFLSDERFKKEIEPIANALDTISQLNGVTYQMRVDEYPKMKFSNQKQIGLIAQNVERVLPTIVSTGPNDYKSVEYSQLIPIMIESIKELKKEIELLKAKNQELEGRE